MPFMLQPYQNTEESDQILLAQYLDKKGILFYHTPNGGRRDIIVAAKLKRMGVKAGIPDICIPVPIHPYHGMYLELKRHKGSSISVHQTYWLDRLSKNGYYAKIAYGFNEAVNQIYNYLQGCTHGQDSPPKGCHP